MSTQIKKNGNWVTVAGGTRMWVGTKAALQAALDAGELVDGTAVMVTDDYEENNHTLVERTFPNFTFTSGTGDAIIGSMPLTKGKWVVQGQIRCAGPVGYARSVSITKGSAVWNPGSYQYVPEVGNCGTNVTAVLELTTDQNVNITGFVSGNVETWTQISLHAVRIGD